MNYTYATLADAQNDVAARLYNSGITFWTTAGLTAYIQESLRTWNALTSFWRAEFPFALTQGTNWYDITFLSGSLRPFTVTDQSLANLLEYHLLEPLTSVPATWTGSSQFTIADLLNAITRRQNDVLNATGCTITRSTVAAPIVRSGIILADTTLDIRRVAWIPEAGNGFDTSIMRQSDAWAKRTFDYSYLQSAEQPPTTWLQNTQPPPRFDVDYVPPVPGVYEVLTVNSGVVSSASSAQTLPIPDDWTWVVKWGALSDLLSKEAIAKDPLRAGYCWQRYQQGLVLMAQSPSVLALILNGIPAGIDAVRNADDFNPSWESLTQGAPESCYCAGLNLIAFATPDSGTYGASLSVVQNAPIPSISGDDIEVDRGDYDAIIDYAQHLAAFKVGGAEFSNTIPLFQKFIERASLYNSKLRVMGQFEMEEYRLAGREQERRPRVAHG